MKNHFLGVFISYLKLDLYVLFDKLADFSEILFGFNNCGFRMSGTCDNEVFLLTRAGLVEHTLHPNRNKIVLVAVDEEHRSMALFYLIYAGCFL